MKGGERNIGGSARGMALGGMILWILFLPNDALAEAQPSRGRKASRSQDPLEIQANRLEYRRKEHLTLYSGDVVAKQQEYRLRCKRLEVHWNPHSGKIARVIARGDVKLRTPESLATSGVALLDLPSKAIILSESPRLVSGEESVEGQRIIYSISERKSTVLGGRGKRVRSRLIPGGNRR
jgi:lipopolysaccharide export system protein LptA